MKISTKNTQITLPTTVTSNIRGQGLTEYAIILSLVAIAAISATSYFGDTVEASFLSLGAELSGEADYDRTAATSAAKAKANTAASTGTTLQNYRN